MNKNGASKEYGLSMNMMTDSDKTHGKKIAQLGICIMSCVLMLLGVFLFIATRRIQNTFGNVSFDQILFHMNLPKRTITSGMIDNLLVIRGHNAIELALFITFVYCSFTIAMINAHVQKLLYRLLHFYSPFLISLTLSSIIFLSGIGIFAYNFKVIQSISSLLVYSTLIDEQYVGANLQEFKQLDEAGTPLLDSKKPNLVLIVSESLEQTFADNILLGKNLITELTKLQDSYGESTKDFRMVHGCHYTIASLYSLHYGLPFLYFASVNGDPIQKNVFHKHCISIFDVMHHAGYQINYLQGASLKFASKDELFAYIPNSKCIGADEISLEEYPERQVWGLYDRDLFDKAKKECNEV